MAPLTKKDLEDYQSLIDTSNARVIAVQKEVADQLRGITQQLVLLAKSNEGILTTLRDLVAKPLIKAVEDTQENLEGHITTTSDKLATSLKTHHDQIKSELGAHHKTVGDVVKKIEGRLENMEKAAITSRTNWVILLNVVIATLTLVALLFKTFWVDPPVSKPAAAAKTAPAAKKKAP